MEPQDSVRGDVARIYFYMAGAHGLQLTADERALFNEWDDGDPLDDREVDLWNRTNAVLGVAERWTR